MTLCVVVWFTNLYRIKSAACSFTQCRVTSCQRLFSHYWITTLTVLLKLQEVQNDILMHMNGAENITNSFTVLQVNVSPTGLEWQHLYSKLVLFHKLQAWNQQKKKTLLIKKKKTRLITQFCNDLWLIASTIKICNWQI